MPSYVEQKNYATVRKIVGYARYEGEQGISALQAVYSAYDPLLNLYYPCMKQVSCERIGAKKKRHYDAAKTPFQRLREQPFADVLEGIRVKSDLRSADALKLRDSIPILAQRDLLDKAVDHLFNSAHALPVIAPHRGARGHGENLTWRIRRPMVRFLRGATRRHACGIPRASHSGTRGAA